MPTSTPAPNRVRLRFLLSPKWIGFHLLVIGGIVAMINLGFWQLRRLDQRREFNAVVEARYDAPVVPIEELLPSDTTAGTTSGTPAVELAEIEWRPVSAHGVFDPKGDITIVNRSQNGVAGSYSVAPLTLDDGRVLLVNRGFVPLAMDNAPPTPTVPVSVVGRLRLTQPRQFAGLSDPATGPLDHAQRVDIERLRGQFNGPVVPMYVELSSSTPATATDGIPDPVVPPDLSDGNHLSYAVQWFLFSIAVAVGWVLAVRKSIATRANPRPEHPPRQSHNEVDALGSNTANDESATESSSATADAAR